MGPSVKPTRAPKLSRRSFLKAGATAAFVSAGAGMLSAQNWLEPALAQAEENTEEKVAHTFHMMHCAGNCSFACTVRDGRLCKIEPSSWPDKSENTICVRGLSEIQHIYGTDRLRTPLKRVGDRGSGEFESISWDEALDIIEERLKTCIDTYGDGSIIVDASGEAQAYPFLSKFLHAKTNTTSGIDIGMGNGFDVAFGGGGGLSTNELRDWKRARTIVNVGCNMLETGLVYGRYFFEALENGATIYTVDPVYSTTAAKSTHWIPIETGTDAALYLGMITLILENGWYDEDYCRRYTNLPALVDDETGEIVRAKTEGEDGSLGTSDASQSALSSYLVWDASVQSAVPYESCDAPELEGTFQIDGRSVSTVFTALRRTQKQYSLAWAAEKTGIDENTIYEMTDAYANNGPQILSFGWGGIDKLSNADIAGHAAVILASLVGSIGSDEGAGAGIYIGNFGKGYLSFGSWPVPDDWGNAAPNPDVDDVRDDADIHAAIVIGDTLQQHHANMNRTIEWVNSLDFVLGIEVYHSTSMEYADIILPACSRFESDEEIGAVRGSRYCLVIKEKVLDPLFDSKPDFKIELEIAKRFGVDQYLPQTSEEYVRFQLSNSKDPFIASVTPEDIIENGGVLAVPYDEAETRMFADKQFGTKTGKVELYYEDLLSFNQALPSYEDPLEVYRGNPLRDKYPLQLSQQRTKYRIHSHFGDASWIRQFIEPMVELNPVDAQSRGLENGDAVTVANDRGSFACVFRANESVRPGTALIYEGNWSKFLIEGNMQMTTNGERIARGSHLMYGPVVPFNDTLVEITKREA